jgi:hypothetical protein
LRTKSTTKVALSRRFAARKSNSRPRTAVLCIAARAEDPVQAATAPAKRKSASGKVDDIYSRGK